MNREEAIEVYHGLINTKIKEAFEFFAPELRESEDERIRKVIYKLMLGMREEIFTSQDEIVTKEKVLAYLEKQKDLDKMIVVSPEVWDNAIADAYENGKKDGEKQKEQKHILKFKVGDKVHLEGDDVNILTITGIEKDRYLTDCAHCPILFVAEDIWKIVEQKPASTEDMPYITDEHFYEREPVDSFKYKLAEYMTRCCTKKEGPYGYEYGISAESILKMAEEELLKRGAVQKPAEWSEEDKRIIKGIIGKIDHDQTYGVSKDEMLNFLKKL